MTQIRTCNHCGEEKPIEEFRPYYGGRKGRYRFCRSCERIQQRHKYLIKRRDAGTLSAKQAEDLAKIDKLYELRRANGLMLSLNTCNGLSTDDLVDTQLARLKEGE